MFSSTGNSVSISRGSASATSGRSGDRRRRRSAPVVVASALAAAAAVLTVGRAARAGTVNTLTNGPVLDDPASWSLGAVPTVANDAVIDATFPTAAAATLTFNSSTSTTQTFGSLNVTNPFGITIQNAASNASGGTPTVTLTLGGAGSTANSVAPSAADLLYVASGSTLTVNNSTSNTATYGSLNIALGQSGNFDVAGTATINGAISGGYGLTKTGAGTLTLNAAGTFTGGTNINQGTLYLAGSAAALGTGTVTINAGGTLQLHTSTIAFTNPTVLTDATSAINVVGTYTANMSGGISGSGTLNKFGTGILQLDNTNTYTGGTVVNQGTLYLYTVASGITGTVAGTGNISVGAATLELRTYATTYATPIALTDPASAIYPYAGYTEILSGAISGSGNLNKTGSATGVLVLSGNNTYAGGTNVSIGTLEFTTTSAIPFASQITLAQNTTLEYNNSTNGVALNRSLALSGPGFSTFNVGSSAVTDSYAGAVTGAGGLNKIGSFGLLLTGPSNTYAGGTNVSGGTLRSNAAMATGTGTVSVLSGATLGGSGSVGPVVLASGGTLTAGASTTSVGTLTSATQTWNAGGGVLTKINGNVATPTAGTPGDSGTPGTANDVLVLSGLSVGSVGLTVTPSVLNTPLTVGSSYSFVLAEIPAANVSTAAATFSSVVSTMTISNPFYFANATFQDTSDLAGDDLLVLGFTAAPEPASLLLLGVAAAPLALGRRRRAAVRPMSTV